MGVTGLWTVVAPTARPTQLATLNRKRLAVDASIWIYQFLKAVRDKEGNALRNSHIVGFFRRICKLLYFGIKPVFVFDGGAPILKRETVRGRARRREGRREDAARTAGKLLAVQVARAAEEEEKRRRAERERTPVEVELPPDQELVYVDELGMTQKERQAGRSFKRKDQYHLPDLDVSIESLGAPNDPRIMSQAELEEYARQFHSGEDVNLYDFSKIDFESPFFLSLPAGDRYNILNAARLRSRLRMGYSKDQLDGMFPDRMAFSKFQIERVKERNELTQRLMHVNGMAEDFLDQGGRIAGEKGKEYVLVKNDGVEGGWALGVVSNRQGSKKENAIDLEEEDNNSEAEGTDSGEDGEFEDVEIEGLNRIPKQWQRKRKEVDHDMSYEDAAAAIARKRKAVYESRKTTALSQDTALLTKKAEAEAEAQGDGLFVPQDDVMSEDENNEDLFEDVDISHPAQEEDDDLQRAIAMSLEWSGVEVGENGDFLAGDKSPTSANNLIPNNGVEDGLDLQAALTESRKLKQQHFSNVLSHPPAVTSSAKNFDGPLPFESLNLGQSLLGKKKSKRLEEELAGGFDRNLGEDAFRKERPAHPMPSWFDAASTTNDLRQLDLEEDEIHPEPFMNSREDVNRQEVLRRQATQSVIDIDAEEEAEQQSDVIHVSSDDEPSTDALDHTRETKQKMLDWEIEEQVPDPVDPQEEWRNKQEEEAREGRFRLAREIAAENETQDPSMNDVADQIEAKPAPPTGIPASIPTPQAAPTDSILQHVNLEVEWSESDTESQGVAMTLFSRSDKSAEDELTEKDEKASRSPAQVHDEEEMFEDVDMEQHHPDQLMHASTVDDMDSAPAQFLTSDDEDEAAGLGNANLNGRVEAELDYFSDSDEELMRQLAVEAEEHARFASSLNNTKTSAQAARDYENELKQLRNQQKKDRRDADEVTQVMVQECQALLRLFGLPYITAPMEAEAQCAELVHLGLVDGIVTDDSDIFLFGGTRIYKNMFNAAKFVECYLATDLEKEYALDRRKLIRFAHLLGSDYTEGIPGVGPVTALEILTDFETLEEFKDWCTRVQLGRPQDLDNQLTTLFRRKFRNTAQKRLFLPPGFPDVRVDLAYLKPEVDSDPEDFQWGVPDLDKLRSFLMATIGWSQDRTDEILVPVIRDINKRGLEGTQANITRFFAGGVGVGAAKEGAAPRNRSGKESGRMAKAFTRLRGEAERIKYGESDVTEATEVPQSDNVEANEARNTAKKSRISKKQKRKSTMREQDDEDGADDENHESAMRKRQRARRFAHD